MRSNLNLLTAAAVLAFGLTATAAFAEDPKGDAPGAKSDITIVKNDTGNASGGTGVEESTESQGVTNKQGMNDAMPPASGAGSAQGGGDNSSDQGGTGVKASADSKAPPTSRPRTPATGVEKSAQGQGAKNKTMN